MILFFLLLVWLFYCGWFFLVCFGSFRFASMWYYISLMWFYCCFCFLVTAAVAMWGEWLKPGRYDPFSFIALVWLPILWFLCSVLDLIRFGIVVFAFWWQRWWQYEGNGKPGSAPCIVRWRPNAPDSGIMPSGYESCTIISNIFFKKYQMHFSRNIKFTSEEI